MVNFFAFILFMAPDGTLAGHMASKEPFNSLDACTEVITDTLTKAATYPMPEGVVKIKGVCLPVQEESRI